MIATESETETRLVEAARELAPRVAARGDEIEQARRLPEDLAQELKDAGFFRMWLPRAYGGLEVEPQIVLTVTEELSRADGSVGWCIRTGVAANYFACQLDPEGAAEVYGSDPSIATAGSIQIKGEAVAVDGGYRVNGCWPLASGCTHSAWIGVNCRVMENGEPRLLPNGQPELRSVFFPAHQVEILDTWFTLGLRGTGSQDVRVQDQFAPARWTYLVGAPSALVEPRPLYRAYALLFPIEGAFALGVAQRALDTFAELAVGKTAFMTTSVLREQQGAQEAFSEAHARVASARRYLLDSEQALWQAVQDGSDGSLEQRADVRLATAHAMRSAVKAVNLIHEAAGTTGVYARSPIERCFRDLHTARADVAVGRLVYRETGRVLFGLPPTNPNF